MDGDDDQQSQAVRAIESILRRAYKQLDSAQQTWISVSKDPIALDDILNQLDQRTAVTSTSLEGTSLDSLPNLKELLVTKIDTQITQLCIERLRPQLDSMADQLASLRSLYERARRACHDPKTGLFLLSIDDLQRRTEVRPAIAELFSWLDEVVAFLEKDLESRNGLLAAFRTSDCRQSITDLRRLWKVPFKVQQRWAWIRFCTVAFLEIGSGS